MTMFFCFFTIILFAVLCIEISTEISLQKFDLDNHGVFTGDEITPDMEKAMIKVTDGTARTFAPFTGFIYSVILTLVLSCVTIFVSFLFKTFKNTQ